MVNYFIIIHKKGRINNLPEILKKQESCLDVKKSGSLDRGNIDPVSYAVFKDNRPAAAEYIYKNEKYLVICDAEIYNRPGMTTSGQNKSLSEAKSIFDLFAVHKENWAGHVQGVFGAFIWDIKNREGWVFTDHIGIKTVIYYEDADYILVANKISAVARWLKGKLALDPQAVFSLTSMEMIPTPYTIFRQVSKLESGHYLYLSPTGSVRKRYWSMSYRQVKETDISRMKKTIYDLTSESVKMMIHHLNGVENSGLFLSGGTDSSTLTGLVSQLYPGQARTFSIGFNESGFDEMYYARIAANAFSAKHVEYYVSADDIYQALPPIIRHLDEPFANSSVIPAYYCSKIAADNGLSVLLGGDGGDEIFGGNARYRDNFIRSAKIPPLVSKLIWYLFKNFSTPKSGAAIKSLYSYVRRDNATLAEKFHAYNIFQYFSPQEIFETDFLAGQEMLMPAYFSQNYIDQADTDHPIDLYLYNDLKLTLMDNDLRKVNQMTELAGITVRYPFLDIRLVEYTGKIPADLKVHQGELRYLFKQTFGQLLPAEIIAKKKHGFGLPVVPWMLRPGKLNDFLQDILFDQKTNSRGIYHNGFINTLYEYSQKDKSTLFGTFLYYILVLELWLREHFDK